MIYRDKTLILLDAVLTEARLLREDFEAEKNINDIKNQFSKLGEDYQSFKETVPDDFQSGSSLERHYHWLDRRLRENNTEACYSDIVDICERDIDHYREDYLEYLKDRGVDRELNEKIFVLLQNNNCDSAVRKSFLVLTERLRSVFSQPKSIDGKDLINQIFGARGMLADKLERNERESLRNLFDGIYGTFRNEFMHNDIEIEIMEAEGIVSMINLLLNRIETIRRKISD